jgi:hypothetical protein
MANAVTKVVSGSVELPALPANTEDDHIPVEMVPRK